MVFLCGSLEYSLLIKSTALQSINAAVALHFMTCQASLCQDPHCPGSEANIRYQARSLGWSRLLCGLANYMCHLQFAITVEIQEDYWSSRGIQICYICIFASQCLCVLEITEIRSHLIHFQVDES